MYATHVAFQGLDAPLKPIGSYVAPIQSDNLVAFG
jgi:hypothetical protein